MKKLTTTALLLSAILTSSLLATVYENGDTGTTEKWDIYDADPAGAVISNIFDTEKQSNVIEFNGTGTDNGYRIGKGSTAWNDTNNSVMKWSMSYNEDYEIFISVQTTRGNRSLRYNSSNVDSGLSSSGTYIHHGLREDSKNGTWQTFHRDLEADLQEFESDNELIAVNAFLIRGSGSVDDIEVIDTMPPAPPAPEYTIYEDAESGDTDKWMVFDTNPVGATISNINDIDKNSNVIEFVGDGTNNGYRIGHSTSSIAWNDKDNKVIRWSMNYSENFYVYLAVKTTTGNKTLYYSPSDTSTGINSSGTYIHHGLGTDASNGTWQTFNRDLEADLKEYDPTNSIVSVNAMLIRGSGMVDDIILVDDNETVTPLDEEPYVETGTITHKEFTYGEVTSPHTGRVWLDRNLGASKPCSSMDETECYGDYYQWGRNADGHEKVNSNTTELLYLNVKLYENFSNIDFGSNFITTQASFKFDWMKDIDNVFGYKYGEKRAVNWSKIDGSSVCPINYRVPTIDELKLEELNASTESNYNIAAFNSFLKLSSAGYRHHVGGTIHLEGDVVSVWSTSPGNDNSDKYNSYFLHFTSTKARYNLEYRAVGSSIRCIKH